MAAVHESLNNEIEALMLDNGGGIGDPHEMGDGGEWMSSFEQHPLRHMQDDTRPVIPIGIYMDGVRYTRATSIGKHDTLLNVNVVNLHTQKRHLLTVTSKKDSCKCGCKGWCSNWITFDFLKWSLEHAARGTRPDFTWDGKLIKNDSPLAQHMGEHMAARFIVVAIKGDWSEYCTTFALPTWAAVNVPCLFCESRLPDLYLELRYHPSSLSLPNHLEAHMGFFGL